MPRVSIITPSFNHAPFLHARAESVLSQEYRDFEWIIIDDASTDESPKLLQQIALTDRRVRLLTNEGNLGMAATVMRALDLASGDLVHRAESDDFCKPSFLGRVVRVFDEHQRVGLVHCAARRADAGGRLSGGWHQPHRDRIDPGRAAFRKLIRGNYIAGPATMFRRAVLQTAGEFAVPPIEIACDYHFALRACFDWDLAYLSARLYTHRVHAANLSGLVGRAMDLELLDRETFGLLDDVFARLPPSWGDEGSLHGQAVRLACLRFGTSLFLAAARRGDDEKATEVVQFVNQKVPGLPNSRHWRRACLNHRAVTTIRTAAGLRRYLWDRSGLSNAPTGAGM